jgi:serine/threonine protein kinase/Tfp pilus assembly protein PilF
LRRGSVFAGRYEIIEELGQGGVGRVYRAFDRKVDEDVALKFLHPDIAADPKTVERFRDELKYARRIIHKNVCRMFDLNESDGVLYITMEYVPGEHLKSFIHRSGQLTVSKAVAVAAQIGEGLAEAHRLNVIHCDLKPQNIMVDKQGYIHIMDFGIARVPRGEGRQDRGLVIGTPGYMSPEQLDGRDPDVRSDIYALGLILFEMLTGRAPFLAETVRRMALKHRTESPPNLLELNPHVPAELERITLKCLEKDPGARYQKVEDFLRDIQPLQKEKGAEEVPLVENKPRTANRETWVGENSVAVLPFSDLSPGRDQEYFCDGLSEEIINALAHVRDMRVAARMSSFFFKGQNIDIREVGKRLNVSLILEGSVRKSGNKLRITAQLINVNDGYHLWSERYDRDIEDVFAVQDEISLTIAEKLRIRVRQDEKEQVVKRHTLDKEAYSLYLKGRFFWNKRRASDLQRAAECFQMAIEKDPGYALAYAGLADTYSMFQGYNLAPGNEACPKAIAMADRALELDPTLPEAQSARGFVSYWFEWNWPKAEFHLKEAARLNPNYGYPHHWLGWYYTAMGRFKAANAEFLEALRDDPLSSITNSSLGYSLLAERRFVEAIDQLRSTLALDADYPRTHYWLGQALAQSGDFARAIDRLTTAAEMTGGHPQYLGALGNVLARAGQRREAEAILTKLNERAAQEFISPVDFAVLQAGLGNAGKAIEELEKGLAFRDGWIIFLNVDARFDALRTHPRFSAILKQIGLA